MTRNELAKAVQDKGIKTPKSPFFMKSAELEALLKKAAPKAKKPKVTVTAAKRGTILSLAAKGLTRKQILAEMDKQGMPTTNVYLNSVSFHEKIKITPEPKSSK
jgi:uncharacterized GH25 family protein